MNCPCFSGCLAALWGSRAHAKQGAPGLLLILGGPSSLDPLDDRLCPCPAAKVYSLPRILDMEQGGSGTMVSAGAQCSCCCGGCSVLLVWMVLWGLQTTGSFPGEEGWLSHAGEGAPAGGEGAATQSYKSPSAAGDPVHPPPSSLNGSHTFPLWPLCFTQGGRQAAFLGMSRLRTCLAF